MSFFDKIGKTFTQGVDRAKFEAEKFQKTTRLQGEVNDMQRQVNEKLMEMGLRAYELQRAGQINIPSIAEMGRIVDALRNNLVTKEEELKAAQNEVFIEPTNPFSAPTPPSQQVPISYEPPRPSAPPPAAPPAAAPQPPPAPAASTRACPSCGFVMPGTAMFCPSCGNRVTR